MNYNVPWGNYPPYQNSFNPYVNITPYRQFSNQPTTQVQSGLNGAMVQSIESITADAVPMDGSVAFFPKQDLSEIYVKRWNPDGTIKTLTFRLAEDMSTTANGLEDQIKSLIAKVDELESTINKNQNGKRNYRKENNQS